MAFFTNIFDIHFVAPLSNSLILATYLESVMCIYPNSHFLISCGDALKGSHSVQKYSMFKHTVWVCFITCINSDICENNLVSALAIDCPMSPYPFGGCQFDVCFTQQSFNRSEEFQYFGNPLFTRACVLIAAHLNNECNDTA